MTQRLTALVIAGLLAGCGQALAGQESEAAAHDRHAAGEGARVNPRFERAERARPQAPVTNASPEQVARPVRPEATEHRDQPTQPRPRVFEQRRHGGGSTVIIEGRGGRGRAAGPPPRVYELRPRVEARARVTVAPRRFYPYAYGGFGLGYYYYDPYWSPWETRGGRGYPRGVYGTYDSRRDNLGRVRLDVRGPRDATVLVDGYYAGTLDDFDGALQGLDLESGAYRIEVEADGFEPLVFDTRISDGRSITLRGAMRRADDRDDQ